MNKIEAPMPNGTGWSTVQPLGQRDWNTRSAACGGKAKGKSLYGARRNAEFRFPFRCAGSLLNGLCLVAARFFPPAHFFNN